MKHGQKNIKLCFGQYFAHLQERKTVVYSNMVFCPNVVVGWRSGVAAM